MAGNYYKLPVSSTALQLRLHIVVVEMGRVKESKRSKVFVCHMQSPEDKRDLSDKTCISVYILTPNHLNIRPISQNIMCISPHTDA